MPEIDDSESPYLFHVTYYARIGAIMEHGLIPGSARAIGGRAYDSHARGRVFLTEDLGIGFWFQRAKDHAEHNSDVPIDDMMVPVVLRIDTRKIDNDKITADGVGTDDSKRAAYAYPEAIPPEAIEIWESSEWAAIEDAEDAMIGADEGGAVENAEENGEHYQIQHLKDSGDSPFFPTESELHTEYDA